MQSSFDAKKTWGQFHEKYECSRHYVIKLKPNDAPPSKDTLHRLPFTVNSAYVRHQDKLYYVNQLKNPPVEEIKATEVTLTAFDTIAMPHEKARPLLIKELQEILPLINHAPLIENRRLKWYRQRLSDKENKLLAGKLESKGPLTNTKIMALLKAQKKWQEKRKTNHLFPVNLRGNHSTEFEELVHHQKIQKSINKENLATLAGALKSANWDHKIFDDPQLPELAMSLFASEGTSYGISRQQTTTILERVQAFKDCKHRGIYPILDQNGQFTQFTKEQLLPYLGQNSYGRLNRVQLEEFRQLVLALPKSEQIWYAMDIPNTLFKLGNTLIKRDTIFFNSAIDVILQLSVGAQDALGLARFKNNYVPRRHVLGTATPMEIEMGVRAKKRMGALSYPKTIAFENIHQYKNITAFEATLHDLYHSNLMSTAPTDILDGFLYAVDAVRAITSKELGSNTSKEIWDLIDC